MKLLIDTELVCTCNEPDEIEGFTEWFAEHPWVSYKLVNNEVWVLQQKICLDEWQTNEIFADLLVYFEYTLLGAAELGGRGCDFSVRIG